ncbi:DUF3304 domain-containing protein, partial [Shigella sp. FC1967]|uniref:DUF3304 domain-containing protein n=1 Tax=Shigella sp. FC1967 TaxID=1898041 RepID=UPI00149399E5
MVEIPEYDDPCDVKVHFLPCQEVRITLSCYSPGHPNYPITVPTKMEEPAVCSKKITRKKSDCCWRYSCHYRSKLTAVPQEKTQR